VAGILIRLLLQKQCIFLGVDTIYLSETMFLPAHCLALLVYFVEVGGYPFLQILRFPNVDDLPVGIKYW